MQNCSCKSAKVAYNYKMILPNYSESFVQSVNEFLNEVLGSRTKKAYGMNQSYGELWSDIHRISMAGGKRLRPYLTLLCSQEEVSERILAVACAQEMIHIAMLVHDDIIDNDSIRHNQLNINGSYHEKYDPFLRSEDISHFANSAALLAGDVLISEAYRLIFRSTYHPDIKQKLLEQFSELIFEVVGGELMDVEAVFRTDLMFDPLVIYRYKTAGYSFVGPILAGAYCAGTNEKEIDILRNFAINAGIAYQLQDDLLGMFGDEAVIGKSTLSDLREGKRTQIIVQYMAGMDKEAHARFAAFGSDKATDEELEMIKHDIQKSGVRHDIEAMVEHYFAAAVSYSDTLPDGQRTRGLREFIAAIRTRRL